MGFGVLGTGWDSMGTEAAAVASGDQKMLEAPPPRPKSTPRVKGRERNVGSNKHGLQESVNKGT